MARLMYEVRSDELRSWVVELENGVGVVERPTELKWDRKRDQQSRDDKKERLVILVLEDQELMRWVKESVEPRCRDHQTLSMKQDADEDNEKRKKKKNGGMKVFTNFVRVKCVGISRENVRSDCTLDILVIEYEGVKIC